MNNKTISNSSQRQSNHSCDQSFDPEAIRQFTGYFKLLAKIDQRLKKEDPEYKTKYYQNKL